MLGGLRLRPADLQPVERYLLDGGKVLFAVKGLEVRTQRALEAEAAGPSALLDLIASYGVRVGRQMVLDTSARDYRLPQAASGGITWESLGRYPPWVSVRSPGRFPDPPDHRRASPGWTCCGLPAWNRCPWPGVRVEVLAQSSPSSWTMKEPFLLDPFRVPHGGGSGGRAAGAGGGAERRLPRRLRGGRDRRGGLTGRGLPTRVVVVGDEDFASDLMQFSDSLHNVLFLENAVLWLTGNEDLLSIKARAPEAGRLDRIADPGPPPPAHARRGARERGRNPSAGRLVCGGAPGAPPKEGR